MIDHQPNQELIFSQLQDFLAEENYAEATALFVDLHLGDQVEVFNFLSDEDKNVLLEKLEDSDVAALFSHQDDDETLEVAENLSIERLADILDEMEPDEAADLLGDLQPEQRAEALDQMEGTDDVLHLLNYPDQTAGGRMTTDFLSLRVDQTCKEAIDILRERAPEKEVRYYLFVRDKHDRLVGISGLRDLVVAQPETLMSEIMDNEVIYVDAWIDQEEVARVMRQYDLYTLPVVNSHLKMVGIITSDDILDVVQEEATEDVYRLSNVSDSQLEPDSPVIDQLKGRLPWLFLNTATALFAAWIVSNFESLIAEVAVLAVFQSVVAGQGGNAASQSVAMLVRAMALDNIPLKKLPPLLLRQMVVGLMQGLAIGIIVGIGVGFWRGNFYLGLVLGLALVGNMLLAGIVGTLIPMGLKAIGQDPALSSTVLVTAITDSVGFLIFLSLAKHFILQLI